MKAPEEKAAGEGLGEMLKQAQEFEQYAKIDKNRRELTEYIDSEVIWVNAVSFASFPDGVPVFEFRTAIPRVGAKHHIQAKPILIAMHPDLARRLAKQLVDFVGTPENPK
jgi:hypothetical protein